MIESQDYPSYRIDRAGCPDAGDPSLSGGGSLRRVGMSGSPKTGAATIIEGVEWPGEEGVG